MLAVTDIEAIFFDMNGTLRTRQAHEPTQRAAIARICKILDKQNVSDAHWKKLTGRLEAYRRWAQDSLRQLSEEEIWADWMLPDEPRERVIPVAAELMLAWSERKGRTIPKPEAQETLAELKRRGYRLGVISNTMSSLDIPRSVEEFGWKGYFDVMVLASGVKARKPAPEPYLEAIRTLNVAPTHCAYVGNRFVKDVVGCKRAGFALGIIIENPEQTHPTESNPPIFPDAVIHSLSELLDIFPGRASRTKLPLQTVGVDLDQNSF
jgi:putative hydrolase of the HAD superfamily